MWYARHEHKTDFESKRRCDVHSLQDKPPFDTPIDWRNSAGLEQSRQPAESSHAGDTAHGFDIASVAHLELVAVCRFIPLSNDCPRD